MYLTSSSTAVSQGAWSHHGLCLSHWVLMYVPLSFCPSRGTFSTPLNYVLYIACHLHVMPNSSNTVSKEVPLVSCVILLHRCLTQPTRHLHWTPPFLTSRGAPHSHECHRAPCPFISNEHLKTCHVDLIPSHAPDE